MFLTNVGGYGLDIGGKKETGKQPSTLPPGIKAKRLKGGWSEAYLLKVLNPLT